MNDAAIVSPPLSFREELREQRWDDHRYYHQSRINQTLHLMSACTFLVVYALIPFEPALAAFLGWVVAMWGRQCGHFFFEPRGHDAIHDVSFQHKEDIKVGFNLQRKVILLSFWLAIPLVLCYDSTAFGLFDAVTGKALLDRIGKAWIALALTGLLARTVWLMATRRVQTGAVWFTKIVTDPYNDIRFYWRAPLALLRGELYDDMKNDTWRG